MKRSLVIRSAGVGAWQEVPDSVFAEAECEVRPDATDDDLAVFAARMIGITGPIEAEFRTHNEAGDIITRRTVRTTVQPV